MQNPITVELARDCEAIQIPSGTATVLGKSTQVEITQSLGGTFTVHAPGGLYRVAGKDADALGMDPPAENQSSPPTEWATEVTEERIWEVLKTCYDPEIPVNIVDLGLVYSLRVNKEPSGLSKVDVKMTLTAPGCGMGAVIARDAQEKILALDGIEEATVGIVWDPPWHQSMITPEGRRALGLP